MRPFNLNVYITVEAATLIGLSFVALTSFLISFVMAKRKKSGNSSGAPQAPHKKGPVDTRPEHSPYASPACTVPFASPMTLPRDVLIKSSKLHAAFEDKLPELPAIPEDIGHVLVHFLHTGNYESLKPKETESSPSRQMQELRTSIQAYAAARAYDLPDLVKLAERQVVKHGHGVSLPVLLEVARDAYPALTPADEWFINYLKTCIRPHLADPRKLQDSGVLAQISRILSPHEVLLNTLFELFCELPSQPPVDSSAVATSTSSSPPPASPISVLQMRNRAVVRELEDALPKSPRPSPGASDRDSFTKETSPEPTPATPKKDVAPVPTKYAFKVEREPEIVYEPLFLKQGKTGAPKAVAEPEVVEASTPQPEAAKVTPEETFKALPIPEGANPAPEDVFSALPVPSAAEIAVAPVLLPPLIPGLVPEPTVPASDIVADLNGAPKADVKQDEAPSAAPERRDSGKLVEDDQPFHETPSAHAVLQDEQAVAEPETEPESERPGKRAFREVDSGFWDYAPSESEPVKGRHSPSVMQFVHEPVRELLPIKEITPEVLPELDAVEVKDKPVDETDSKDELKKASEAEQVVKDDVKDAKQDDETVNKPELPTETKDVEPEVQGKTADVHDESEASKTATSVADQHAVVETTQTPEVDTPKPSEEKAAPASSSDEPAAANDQSKRDTEEVVSERREDNADKVGDAPVPDASGAVGSSNAVDATIDAKERQPSTDAPIVDLDVKPKPESKQEPAGEPASQSAAAPVAGAAVASDAASQSADSSVDTISVEKSVAAAVVVTTAAAVPDGEPAVARDAKPAPEQQQQPAPAPVKAAEPKPAHANGGTASPVAQSAPQPLSAHERSRSNSSNGSGGWKRKFLKYPVLFGRGM